MNSPNFPLSFIATLLFAATSAQAAQEIKISHTAGIKNINEIASVAKLDQNYHFKLTNKVKLDNGNIKVKFDQYYQGIPIWGVSISATEDNSGYLKDIFGNYLIEVEKDLHSTQPVLKLEDALNIAKAAANLSAEELTKIGNVENKIYIIIDQNNKARLVYFISFMINSNAPRRPHIMIDARTSEIIQKWEGLATKNAIGPGGNSKTGQYNYGTDFGFLVVTDTCQMDSPNAVTWDMKNQTSGGAVHQFDCSGNPPINTYRLANGAFSPINDAHFFGNVVFNMYNAWFNKSPLTQKLKLRVHYGTNYQNAFWDGQQMTFGDGASTFFPFTGLDVVSHEVSHGFTQQNSNLTYSKQPGGINEAFSDMAGEAAEYFNTIGKATRNDWLVGATIIKASGIALRYFADPTRDGSSIGNAKDYHDGLDVHYSSGVFNKAFYTLATKAGWDVEKAFRAFVLANQVYWNQGTNFEQGGCGVMKAAKDLNYNTADVISAFNAVGVNASCGTTAAGILQAAVAGVSPCIIPATQQFTVNYSSGGTSNSFILTGTTSRSVTLPSGTYSINVTPATLPTNSQCTAKYNQTATITDNQTTQERISYETSVPPPPQNCTINSICVTWGSPTAPDTGSSCNFSIKEPTTLTSPAIINMQANGIRGLRMLFNAMGNFSGGQVNLQLKDAANPKYGFLASGVIRLPATASLRTNGRTYTCNLVQSLIN